jgi:hypothetical protein
MTIEKIACPVLNSLEYHNGVGTGEVFVKFGVEIDRHNPAEPKPDVPLEIMCPRYISATGQCQIHKPGEERDCVYNEWTQIVRAKK